MTDPNAPNAPGAKELVRRISKRLHAAAHAAGAAEACAEVGNVDLALAMVSDVEATLYELMTLLNAASLLRGDQTAEDGLNGEAKPILAIVHVH
jgi:hypothetical protein